VQLSGHNIFLMHHYYIFHKPFRVLSQFSAEGDKKTLSDFFHGLPKNIYPVGRLDYDSEGLLLLTDDKALTHQLLDPSFGHARTYWVQVEGAITQQAIQQIAEGITILTEEPAVAERNPPIRYRKNIPTSWISLTLTEGKNRQVRHMAAAAGYPVLRLIRYAIGTVTIDGMAPGANKPADEGIKELLLSKK